MRDRGRSLIALTSIPAVDNARIADSRPAPGPETPNFHGAEPVFLHLVRRRQGRLLRGKGSALARAAESERARTRPGQHIAERIGERDNRVIEGGLNVHDTVRHNLLFLLLQGFFFFVDFAGAFAMKIPARPFRLGLPSRLLLVGDRPAARILPGTGVGVGTLAANRQTATVTEPPVGAHLDEPFDVHVSRLARFINGPISTVTSAPFPTFN